jgi:hypothetical protein
MSAWVKRIASLSLPAISPTFSIAASAFWGCPATRCLLGLAQALETAGEALAQREVLGRRQRGVPDQLRGALTLADPVVEPHHVVQHHRIGGIERGTVLVEREGRHVVVEDVLGEDGRRQAGARPHGGIVAVPAHLLEQVVLDLRLLDATEVGQHRRVERANAVVVRMAFHQADGVEERGVETARGDVRVGANPHGRLPVGIALEDAIDSAAFWRGQTARDGSPVCTKASPRR